MTGFLDAPAHSTRAELIRERIEWLSRNDQLKVAARVAKTFGMDPVAVLDDGGDERLVHLRIAAYVVVGRDEEEAARKMKSK